MKLPSKYRLHVVSGVWTVYALSVGLAFFSLPPVASVSLAIVGIALPALATRLCYVSPVLWVMPTWSDRTNSNRLGVVWFKEPYQGKQRVGMALLFEDRECAKEAFVVLRAWNFGNFIDTHGNILLSIVREGSHHYTVFLYPGKRKAGAAQIDREIKATKGPNHEAQIRHLLRWTSTCINCEGDPNKENFIESLHYDKVLLLNTMYATDTGVKAYSKRPIILKAFDIIDRLNIQPGTMEHFSLWEDMKSTQVQSARRVKELEKLIRAEQVIPPDAQAPR
jgi:hypothetical protein